MASKIVGMDPKAYTTHYTELQIVFVSQPKIIQNKFKKIQKK